MSDLLFPETSKDDLVDALAECRSFVSDEFMGENMGIAEAAMGHPVEVPRYVGAYIKSLLLKIDDIEEELQDLYEDTAGEPI